MVIVGGLSMDDTWLYNVEANTWKKHAAAASEDSSPGVRHGAGVVIWNGPDGSDKDRLLLVGGSRVNPVIMYNDAWLFHPAEGWRRLQANIYHPTNINTPVPLKGAQVNPLRPLFVGLSVARCQLSTDMMPLFLGVERN